jgi:glyoxylase-like metal-dependent hydrolase (beta-lactamase superfamily II)
MTAAGSFTRRRFIVTAGVAGVTVFASRRLFAQQNDEENGIVPTMVKAAAAARITVSPLRRNISMIEGSGGNIAVLTGRDGKVLIDAGFAVSRMGISSALTSISADPIRHLVNTHWHTDHTNGNAWLNDAGAAIMAHQNTRKHLSVATRVDAWKYTFSPAPAGALPTRVFASVHKLRLNDTDIFLKYYGPAHTDSDISVTFGEADVLHAADTFWNGVYPFIDYSTGGSIDGQIRAAAANITAAGAKTIVIPGHGPIGDKTQLIEFHTMLSTIREKVASLKKQGRSLDETIAAKPTAAFDARWGNFLITPATFTALVYQGV